MKYHINDKFSREECEYEEDEEEITKQIVMIRLKNIKEGFDKPLLDSLVDQAIKKAKKYTIYNCQEGLLVEKQIK